MRHKHRHFTSSLVWFSFFFSFLVCEPHLQLSNKGHHSALITLIQTGVRPREKGLHNYTRSGRLSFVSCFHSNQPTKYEELSRLMPRVFVCTLVWTAFVSEVWAVFLDSNRQVVSQNSHVNSKNRSPKYSPAGMEAHPDFQYPSTHTQELNPRTWKQTTALKCNSSNFRRFRKLDGITKKTCVTSKEAI